MRSREKRRLGALRLITAAIKQREVDERIALTDAQVLAVLEKMVKQRRESVAQYQAGNRPDLVDQENFELHLIQSYLPAQLSEAEIDRIIDEAVVATGASSARDMGKVMGALKGRLAGQADMSAVSSKVRHRLGT